MRGIIAVCSSALLYSISLQALDRFYFLSVPALLILTIVIFKNDFKRNAFLVSLFWFPIVIVAHYSWVVELLDVRFKASYLSSVMVYVVISLVHLLCMSILFCCASLSVDYFSFYRIFHRFNHHWFIVLFLISFQISGSMLMLIFDSQGCYNLMSPMIALSKFFMPYNKDLNDIFIKKSNSKSKQKICVFLPFNIQLDENNDLWVRGQQLYNIMRQTKPHQLIVTPESCINYPINERPEFVSFIKRSIKPLCGLMLCSQYKDERGNLFQASYFITHNGVEYYYRKQNAIPCAERMPWYLRSCTMLTKIFKAEQSFALAPCDKQHGFYWGTTRIVPRICSDFFLMMSVYDLIKLRHKFGSNLVVVVQANDKGFTPSMRYLLKHVAMMRAWLAGVDLVYVGYQYN